MVFMHQDSNKISVLKGDITRLEVEAIVNAANSSLLGGGGVDGAIHKAGGNSILEECIKIRNRQGGCAIGDAVITTAGNLKAKYVIHTVGPVWNGGTKEEVDMLKRCYENSFRLAYERNIKSIAYPCISTGIYRFPKEIAANIAVSTIASLTQKHPNIEVIFVCFDEENYLEYKKYI
jgi:O-acetyl-ADP-ribose deacetylase (regulator of RNase III)